uniref:Uncharacterized protein n=1 Tax=Oryza glumipatula TaxID=40148 RepID=A0A0D9Y907_9ORYZ
MDPVAGFTPPHLDPIVSPPLCRADPSAAATGGADPVTSSPLAWFPLSLRPPPSRTDPPPATTGGTDPAASPTVMMAMDFKRGRCPQQDRLRLLVSITEATDSAEKIYITLELPLIPTHACRRWIRCANRQQNHGNLENRLAIWHIHVTNLGSLNPKAFVAMGCLVLVVTWAAMGVMYTRSLGRKYMVNRVEFIDNLESTLIGGALTSSTKSLAIFNSIISIVCN